MTFLPIVERELRISSRLAATYRNRTLVAGCALLGAFLMLEVGVFASVGSNAGVSMFHVLSFLAMLFCALEGVHKTADCLSEEKREGTLGLLFLTDLKGYDVVFGKLVATSLSSIYGLFAILPVLALPIIVGGVLPGEFWRMVLALANILFFSLCAGMLVSARSYRGNHAMIGTLLLVAAFMVLPRAVGSHALAAFSPTQAYLGAFASGYSKNPYTYWLSLVLTQLSSWLLLMLASVKLPHWWQEGAAEKPISWPPGSPFFKIFNDPARREKSRREMLETNPALWLAARGSARTVFLWGLAAVTALGGLICLCFEKVGLISIFFGIAWLVNLAFKLSVTSQACHCLSEARRNSALEMLLVTPLKVEQIISGQLAALRRIFLGPALALIFIELFIVLALFAKDHNSQGNMDMDGLGIVLMTFYFGLAFLDIVSLTWAGMWFGLRSKKEAHAFTKTVLLVLLLPYFFLGLGVYGMPLFIGLPIFWIGWCNSNLKANFRTLAAQRYIPPTGVPEETEARPSSPQLAVGTE